MHEAQIAHAAAKAIFVDFAASEKIMVMVTLLHEATMQAATTL